MFSVIEVPSLRPSSVERHHLALLEKAQKERKEQMPYEKQNAESKEHKTNMTKTGTLWRSKTKVSKNSVGSQR